MTQLVVCVGGGEGGAGRGLIVRRGKGKRGWFSYFIAHVVEVRLTTLLYPPPPTIGRLDETPPPLPPPIPGFIRNKAETVSYIICASGA
jgi:hypothetical protein